MIDTLRNALQQGLAPEHLEVADESHMHSRGQNTHYKATIVSDTFQGLSPVRRHQAVYAALGELMGQFHALALHTYTRQEWQQRASHAPDSPRCEGGSRFD